MCPDVVVHGFVISQNERTKSTDAFAVNIPFLMTAQSFLHMQFSEAKHYSLVVIPCNFCVGGDGCLVRLNEAVSDVFSSDAGDKPLDFLTLRQRGLVAELN